METVYYIYHIKGVKIGVSEEPLKRVNNQGYSEYEILETHTDIIKASERELELQKQYGYVVDKNLYYKIYKTAKSGIGGKKASGKGGRNNSSENKSRAGKIGGKKNRQLSYEDAQQIREYYSLKQYNQYELAEIYKVNRITITQIISNKIYKEL